MILYADVRSNIATPRRFALARMIIEAGLRSPRTQLTKVQIAISVQGRCTEAIRLSVYQALLLLVEFWFKEIT